MPAIMTRCTATGAAVQIGQFVSENTWSMYGKAVRIGHLGCCSSCGGQHDAFRSNCWLAGEQPPPAPLRRS